MILPPMVDPQDRSARRIIDRGSWRLTCHTPIYCLSGHSFAQRSRPGLLARSQARERSRTAVPSPEAKRPPNQPKAARGRASAITSLSPTTSRHSTAQLWRVLPLRLRLPGRPLPKSKAGTDAQSTATAHTARTRQATQTEEPIQASAPQTRLPAPHEPDRHHASLAHAARSARVGSMSARVSSSSCPGR